MCIHSFVRNSLFIFNILSMVIIHKLIKQFIIHETVISFIKCKNIK